MHGFFCLFFRLQQRSTAYLAQKEAFFIQNTYRFPFRLFLAVLLLQCIPALYETFRIWLLSTKDPSSFSVLGHIEWFDLFHEVLLTACIVPLYYLYTTHKEELGSIVKSTSVLLTVLYSLYAALILLNLESIMTYMHVETQFQEVKRYLTFETVSLFLQFLQSFLLVALLVLGKDMIFYGIIMIKTFLFVVSDVYFIPTFDILGVAYSNITVQSLLLFYMLRYLQKHLHLFTANMHFSWWKSFLHIGGFSGGQIILDNLLYGLVVMQMITLLQHQDHYWVANNFIWGILLLPVFSLAEIMKREALITSTIRSFWVVSLVIVGIWLLSLPFWNVFFTFFYGFDAKFADNILHIVYASLPYYIVYVFSSIYNSLFVGKGKTYVLFGISCIVNLVYYPLLLLLVNQGIFSVSMDFIIHLFGCGIVLNFLLGISYYYYSSLQNKKATS